MNKDFTSMVKEKTKDELIRIIINKEEYKVELVEAATAELKRRDKELPSTAPNPTPRSVPVQKEKETPFGIYLAGILFFLTGPAWLFVGSLQAGASTITEDFDIGLIGMWNIIFAVLSIVIGIGLLKGYRWGYQWGVGTAIVNILWFGFKYYDSVTMPVLLLILIELIILVSIAANREYFTAIPIGFENTKVKAPTDYSNDDDYQQSIIRLNNLIREAKNSIFQSASATEIKRLISELGSTKDNAEYLLESYKGMYGTDLIDDLKKVTSSYDGIKEYCMTFINHGLVEKTYPHERRT